MIPKFRAWVKKENRMINVTFIDFLLEEVCEEVLLINKYDFKNIELMQSTGLKDIHNQEIFEGDVVIFDYYDKEYRTCVARNEETNNLVFKNIDKDNHFKEFSLMYSKHSIVLGNIYENPELLKKGSY